MTRRVVLVGIGPGDPEQVTLEAVRAMNEVDFFVVTAGCTPVWIAYCSAGSPNASHPIGCSTLNPFIRLCRETMSVAVYPSGWPTCSPAPDGYGNMSRQ